MLFDLTARNVVKIGQSTHPFCRRGHTRQASLKTDRKGFGGLATLLTDSRCSGGRLEGDDRDETLELSELAVDVDASQPNSFAAASLDDFPG